MTRDPETIEFWRGRLPHWEVVGGLYFVTIRLKGAIPEAAAIRIRNTAAQIQGTSNYLKYTRKIFRNMKRWTTNNANSSLGLTGRFWQQEWFDHWSRSPEQDAGIVRYIRNNPVKAGLVARVEDWPLTWYR